VETPPRSSATKRQKTVPEIIIKIECLNSSFSDAFEKHFIFLHKITAISSHDIKVLNKRSKVFKNSSLQALTDEPVYKNHFNIHVKETNDKQQKHQSKKHHNSQSQWH
jgi:hypothetical protein